MTYRQPLNYIIGQTRLDLAGFFQPSLDRCSETYISHPRRLVIRSCIGAPTRAAYASSIN